MSFTFIELIIVLSYLLLLLISGLALCSIHGVNRILYELEVKRFQEVTLDDLQGETDQEEEEETNEEDDHVEEETDQEQVNEEVNEEQETEEEVNEEEVKEEQEATKEELLQMIDSWKPLADSLKTE